MVEKVVIVGAGFAGIEAALKLRSKSSSIDIRVFDSKPHFVYKPSLHEISTGSRSVKTICINYKKLFSKHKIFFYQEEILSVKPEKRVVLSANRQVEFDYLLLSSGSTVNYRGVPGMKEHAYSLESVSDAKKIRKALSEEIEKAKSYNEPPTILIIGSGLTGVEMAGEVVDLVGKRAKVIVTAPSRNVLSNFSLKSIDYVEDTLKSKGVEFKFGSPVASIAGKKVTFKDKSYLYAPIVIWCGGIKPSPLMHKVGLRTSEHGSLMVNDFLQTAHRNIYSAGDCSYQFNNPQPWTAQTAIHQGGLVANNIWADINDENKTAYLPKKHPYLVSVGKNKGILYSQKSLIKGRIPLLMKSFVEKEYLLKRKGFFS